MVIKKISLLLTLLISAQCAYTMKAVAPKKVTAPKKTQTHLISPSLSNDVALIIKQLIKDKVPSKSVATTPVTITKKPAESIKAVAAKAVVKAKLAKSAPKATK